MKAFYTAFHPDAHTRVLDIGGTPNTWLAESGHRADFPVTLANIRPIPPSDLPEARFTPVYADATALPFPDAGFDIAFSNSVIEHVYTWEKQQAFAAEARRVAKRLWIQTPARHFPIESHVWSPFFQYLPLRMQRRLARRFTLRGLLTRPTQAEVDEILSDIRLLTYREMKQLFPDCRIHRERVLGFTKIYGANREDAKPQPAS